MYKKLAGFPANERFFVFLQLNIYKKETDKYIIYTKVSLIIKYLVFVKAKYTILICYERLMPVCSGFFLFFLQCLC